MIRHEEGRYSWYPAGLRARFRPKPLICGGLISAAPWLNLLVLLIAFILLTPRLVLPPGRRIELPEGSLTQPGSHSITAVVLSHRQSNASDARSELIFFEDQPFSVDNPAQMQELKRRFFRVASEHPESILVIEADIHVEYGTIAKLCSIAAKTGLKTVHLAGRLPGERAQ